MQMSITIGCQNTPQAAQRSRAGASPAAEEILDFDIAIVDEDDRLGALQDAGQRPCRRSGADDERSGALALAYQLVTLAQPADAPPQGERDDGRRRDGRPATASEREHPVDRSLPVEANRLRADPLGHHVNGVAAVLPSAERLERIASGPRHLSGVDVRLETRRRFPQHAAVHDQYLVSVPADEVPDVRVLLALRVERADEQNGSVGHGLARITNR